MSTNIDELTEKTFGKDGEQFLQFVQVLISSLESDKVNYKFIDSSEYEILLKKDWKSAAKVYWEELLARVHFAAAASAIRAHRWVSGMQVSHSNNLFLPFCASFRALIESAADGYDALGSVPITLAGHRKMVNQTLQLKAEQFVVAEELENQLIHFSHARKVSKGSAAPPAHNAKQVAEYVRALESSGLAGLYDCYSELCQYTHPAADSVAHLLEPVSASSFLLMPAYDYLQIEAFLEKYRALLLPLLMSAFTPGALTLKVMLYFDTPQFHNAGIRKINLDNIQAWRKCAITMGV